MTQETPKPTGEKVYWVYSGWNCNGQFVSGHLHAIPVVTCADSAKRFVALFMHLTRVDVSCRTTGELNEVNPKG